jgi:hypothetical protein
MADREAIEIFASFFELLATDPTPQHKGWALKLWKQSQNYDFNDRQLECDEQLLRLDLAKMRGEEIVYGPVKGERS